MNELENEPPLATAGRSDMLPDPVPLSRLVFLLDRHPRCLEWIA